MRLTAIAPSATSTVWYFAPTLVGAALPFITLPVVTRILTPHEYGAWVLAYVFATFISGIGNFGLAVAYERNFFEYSEPRQGASLLWGTVACVMGFLGLLVTLTWLARDTVAAWIMRSAEHSSLLAWTTTASAVASIKVYFLLHLRNRHEARAYALYSIDESVLGAVLTMVFVAGLRVGPQGLAYGPLAASALVLSLLLLRFARSLPVAFDMAPVTASLRMSVPLLPRILLGVVGTQFDKWIVGFTGSTGSAAIYAIGQRLANAVFLFATTLESAFQPRTYRLMFDHRDDASGALGRMLTPYAAATVGIALLVTLFADEALRVLTAASYRGGATIANILVFHYALMFFGKQPQLIYARRTDLSSLISMGSILLTAAATALLAVRYGAIGAALGMLGSGILTTAALIRVSQRHFRIRYESARLCLLYGVLAVASLVIVLLRATGAGVAVVYSVKGAILVSAAWYAWAAGWWLRSRGESNA